MTDAFGRARRLVGTRFLPQGRDPSIGLDCIGLVLSAYALRRPDLPRYRLSDGDWATIDAFLTKDFVPVAEDKGRCADLMVLRLPRSFHFAVLGERSFIHAEARLKRVLETPLPAPAGDCRLYRSREGH